MCLKKTDKVMGKKRRKNRKTRKWLVAIKAFRRTTKGRFLNGLVGVVSLGFVVFCLLLPTDKMASRHFGLRWNLYCFMNDVFGLEYASAGLTRSFSALCRGEFTQAFRYHHIGPILFAFIVMQIPYRTWAISAWPRAVPQKVRTVHAGFCGLVVIMIIFDWLFLLG